MHIPIQTKHKGKVISLETSKVNKNLMWPVVKSVCNYEKEIVMHPGSHQERPLVVALVKEFYTIKLHCWIHLGIRQKMTT